MYLHKKQLKRCNDELSIELLKIYGLKCSQHTIPSVFSFTPCNILSKHYAVSSDPDRLQAAQQVHSSIEFTIQNIYSITLNALVVSFQTCNVNNETHIGNIFVAMNMVFQ